MSGAQVLVVAKAPVAGRVKTRLGKEIGMESAAAVAAASLRDTLLACIEGFGAARCHLALEGDLTDAVDGAEIATLLDGWSVFPQRGDGLAGRLVQAHLDVAARLEAPVVQIGMDTPQVTPELITDAAVALEQHDAVLGPAEDGGWWVLGLRDPRRVTPLADVPMSTPTTGEETRSALEQAGLVVALTTPLRDVDTVADAHAVAALTPTGHFSRTWSTLAPPRR